MNPYTVAARMKHFVPLASQLPAQHPAWGRDHVDSMCDQVLGMNIRDRKEREKAMRWIGYIQACLVMGQGITLEQCKDINKDA